MIRAAETALFDSIHMILFLSAIHPLARYSNPTYNLITNESNYWQITLTDPKLQTTQKQILKQAGKGIFAILDQGIYSISNFGLSILLARWLPEVEYGNLSVALILYFFLAGFHNAIILEPISILGTKKYAAQLKNYLASQYPLHIILSLSISIFTFLSAFLLFRSKLITSSIYQALAGLSLFVPLMLLTLLVRRIFYILSRPSTSMIVSLLYTTGITVGVSVLYTFTDTSRWTFLIFVVYGMASLISTLPLYWIEHMAPLRNSNFTFPLHMLFKEQWQFGKWVLAATFLNFIGTQIQFFSTSYFLAFDGSGIYRALQNVILPFIQASAAISAFFVPSIALAYSKQDIQEVKKRSFRLAAFMSVVGIAYLAALIFFPTAIENLLYGGKFEPYQSLIPWFGGIPILLGLTMYFALINRVIKPEFHFYINGTYAVIGLVTAPLFTKWWNLFGAIISLNCIYLSALVVNIILYWRWFQSQNLQS